MNITIIALILAGLVVHRYLSTFWEQGTLPYSFGFVSFANKFSILYLINFIWMFGALAGIIITILCYFQIVYSSGLWIFSVPWAISSGKNPMEPLRVNQLVYGGFSFHVMLLAILTVINFFITPYRTMWETIENDLWPILWGFVGLLIIGNVLRVVVMAIIFREE